MTRTKYTMLFTLMLLPLLIGLACETTTPADLATATPTPPASSPITATLASTATPGDDLQLATPQPTMITCAVNSLALNVRSGPGLDYPAIAWLHNGDQVTVTTKANNWLRITSGWIKADYCK